MYRVTYYAPGGKYSVQFKEFQTFKEATDFSISLPIDAVLEIKYYENSDNYRPTFWSEE